MTRDRNCGWINLIILVCLCLPVPSSLADEVWTEDATAAIETAVNENKDLLLLFTGSDWCPPCQKLEKEVLSIKDFEFEITKHFVLVKLDFPRESPQDPEIEAQNQEWAGKFGVDSFPTIILVDQQLKPYAIAGYEEGGFENYLGLLEESRVLRVKRDEKLKLAESKKGLERARLLDEAISELREEIINLYYPEIVEEIVKLDADDELGLRTKWNEAKDAEMRKIIMTDVMMISRLEKPAKAMQFIDEVLSEIKFPAAQKLEIFQIKLNLARQLDEPAQVDEVLDQMINLEGVGGTTRDRLIVKKILLMIGGGREDAGMEALNSAIGENPSSVYLLMAKGEILDSKDQFEDAIEVYDAAVRLAQNSPDVLIDLISAKADALFAIKKEAAALQILDQFADDTRLPSDLRAEALLHKSMIMRDMNRTRQARLAENRAIEVAESPQQRAEMQKIVERLREKYKD